MPLTDTAIRNARPDAKARKLSDGAGLFILLSPTGARLWRMKYRINGREKLLSFGQYPEVSPKLARERREEARRLLAENIDPAEKRKAEKQALPDTFEAVAREFLALKAKNLDARTHALKVARLESFIFPRVGKQSITKVTPMNVQEAMHTAASSWKRYRRGITCSPCARTHRDAFWVMVITRRGDPPAQLRGAQRPE